MSSASREIQLPNYLMDRIEAAAEKSGRSFNEELVVALVKVFGLPPPPPPPETLEEKIQRLERAAGLRE